MAIPKYIDEKEVSKIIGRGVQTLRNDRHNGRGLPYVKFGRQVRYELETVIREMESRKIEVNPIVCEKRKANRIETDPLPR